MAAQHEQVVGQVRGACHIPVDQLEGELPAVVQPADTDASNLCGDQSPSKLGR